MLIIGLTGGIATGKSTVSSYLNQKHGWKIVDADKIAHSVVLPGTRSYSKIVEHFGPKSSELLLADGTLNRPVLGRIVFGNEPERQFLNSIVHPAVRQEMLKQVLVAWLCGNRVVLLDVPLLFESSLDRFCSSSLLVACSANVELRRLMSRDAHLSKEEAENRIGSQMPLDKKRLLADEVIENDGTLDELYPKLDALVARLQPSWLWTLLQWIPPIGLLCAVLEYFKRKSQISSHREKLD